MTELNLFFLIGKDTIHIKRDAKKVTQGIQYLYTHLQKDQKEPRWPRKQP